MRNIQRCLNEEEQEDQPGLNAHIQKIHEFGSITRSFGSPVFSLRLNSIVCIVLESISRQKQQSSYRNALTRGSMQEGQILRIVEQRLRFCRCPTQSRGRHNNQWFCE